MLLDEVFEPLPGTELVIIRKNGHLSMKSVPVKIEPSSTESPKPLFPIDKERK